MEILWLLAGLAAGTGLTLIVLYLFKKRSQTSYVAERVIYSPETQHMEVDLESYVGNDRNELETLGDEHELTESEMEAFDLEDVEDEHNYSGDLKNPAVLLALSEERAATSGEILEDKEERISREREANNERAKFIKFKKAKGVSFVPTLRFTLSREDVIDYLEDKRNDLLKDNSSVLPDVHEKHKHYYADTMYCGDWCFGFMHERSNVVKFTLRLDDKYAEKLKKEHTAFRIALFPKGENWFDLIIDQSFISKGEVYQILDNSFNYVFAKYYKKEYEAYVTDLTAAKADAEQVSAEVAEAENAPDPIFETAIDEFKQALEKFRQKHKLPFVMTRKRILHYINLHYIEREADKGAEIITREKRYLPASLRENGRTYALVYEKVYPADSANAGKIYVSLIVRISDGYATWLSLKHAGVRRASFPKNRNWYIVPVDASFHSAQMVYRVLKHARNFVK